MERYVAGLDLGQSMDYTAFSVLQCTDRDERVEAWGDVQIKRVLDKLSCRHFQRFPLGTPYPEIVRRVQERMNAPQLADEAVLVIDKTGVGAAVFDQFEEAGLRPRGIVIHGGDRVTRDGSTYRVPKRDLIHGLQVKLQNRALEISGQLPDHEEVVKELLNYKVEISAAGHDSYNAREGKHDDILLSLAVAAWYAENERGKNVLRAYPNYFFGEGGGSKDAPEVRVLEQRHSDHPFHIKWSKKNYCPECNRERGDGRSR